MCLEWYTATHSDWIPMSHHSSSYTLPATYKRKLFIAMIHLIIHSSAVTQDESVEHVLSSKLSVQWLGCPVDSLSFWCIIYLAGISNKCAFMILWTILYWTYMMDFTSWWTNTLELVLCWVIYPETLCY